MLRHKVDWVYYLIPAVLLVISTISGYLIGQDNPGLAQRMIQNTFSGLPYIQRFTPWGLFLFIFLNNAIKTFLIIFFGFAFGLVPFYFVYANGKLLGLVAAVTTQRLGVLTTLAGLLPHGIIELTALIIAAGYGVKLGAEFTMAIAKQERFGSSLKIALHNYWRVVLPLLFFAALVETFITPIFLALVAR